MTTSKLFTLSLILVVLALLPFFEGGETAFGLLIFHTLTLLGLTFACLYYSRTSIPRFIVLFIPFFLILILSFFLSAYKFASFIKLWDFFEAGIWAILVCTGLQAQREKFLNISSWIFIGCVCSTIIAILIYNTSYVVRVSASFLNPNDYATFALLFFCFGMFCLERETGGVRRTILITFLGILLVTVALSFSRGIFLAILSILFLIFLKQRPGKTMTALLIFLLCCSGLIVALRFRFYEDPFQYHRIKIWKSSLRAVSEDPYLGVGLGMLEYRSNSFNFPAETEIGRYRRIARSADNQYIQILVETGFLGFFTFLFGWIGLAFYLKNLSNRFFYLKLGWVILTVTGFFSLPLQNTSVLFLFLFLVAAAASMDNEKGIIHLALNQPGRILIPVGSFLLFVFAVYLPYRADREFYLAVTSPKSADQDAHLAKALRYNPYQPYYQFVFLQKIIDAKPDLDEKQWMTFSILLDQSIALNPFEYQFYEYKARAARQLLKKNPNLTYFSSAVSSYQNALDCNPFNVFLRMEYASFLFQSNRYDVAQSELEKILTFEPAFLSARLLLTALLLQTNHPQEAKVQYLRFTKDYERFRNQASYPISPYVRGLLLVDPQQKQKVEEMYNKAPL